MACSQHSTWSFTFFSSSLLSYLEHGTWQQLNGRYDFFFTVSFFENTLFFAPSSLSLSSPAWSSKTKYAEEVAIKVNRIWRRRGGLELTSASELVCRYTHCKASQDEDNPGREEDKKSDFKINGNIWICFNADIFSSQTKMRSRVGSNAKKDKSSPFPLLCFSLASSFCIVSLIFISYR